MILADNRRAKFDYEVVNTLEAGMVLFGWEVKSLRNGGGNLKSAWVTIQNGEAFLLNFKISPWRFGTGITQESLRAKKILLHKSEILKLEQQIRERRYTLVPLQVYLAKGKIKCEIAVGKGRKKYEKRQVLKERAIEKEARNAMRR